jgi:hypothetical protein
MNQRRRRDEGVAFGPRVGNVKSRAALRHHCVDRQDTAFKPGENLIQPRSSAPCSRPICSYVATFKTFAWRGKIVITANGEQERRFVD